MEYQYTIDDLAAIAEKSKQSIYNLLSKDKAFIRTNSIKQNRKIKYNQHVLNMILSYYEKSPIENASTSVVEANYTPSTAPLEEKSASKVDASKQALQAEIQALRKQLDDKNTIISKLEAEKAQMIKQNGLALLILQQEQQEKILLLSAPKKSLPKRIKEFFMGSESPSK